MAVDLNQLIEVQKDALLRDLGDEVELIFRYGSFLKNATHRYSDLDISYVPVHEATWHSITVMVDVALMPDNSFGYVPTPAIVAPIEFTMRLADYKALGGHVDRMLGLADVLAQGHARGEAWNAVNPWPLAGPA